MYYLAALAEYSGPEPGFRGTRISDTHLPSWVCHFVYTLNFTQPRLSGKRFIMKSDLVQSGRGCVLGGIVRYGQHHPLGRVLSSIKEHKAS